MLEDTNFDKFLARLGMRAHSQSGGNALVFCPIHGDVGTASLSIRSDGMFCCFSGACDAKGGGFIWLAQKVGFSREEAAQLCREYGLPERADLSARRGKEERQYVLTGKWHVDWAEVASAFQNGRVSSLDPAVATAARWIITERRVAPTTLAFAEVGVSRQTGELVFPQFVTDEDGNRRCVGVSTRSPAEKRIRNHFDTRSWVWLPPDPSDTGTPWVVLVEGQIDALRVRFATFRKAGTCLYGSEISDGQVDKLAQYDKIVLFLDNDKAGMIGTTKILARLGPHRCEVVTQYFGEKDAGDMTNEQIRDAFTSAVDGRQYVSDGVGRHRLHLVRGGA